MTHDPFAPPTRPTTPVIVGPYGLARVVQGIAVAWCLLLLVDCVEAFQAAGNWRDAATNGRVPGPAEAASYEWIGYLYVPVQIAAFLVGSLWLYRSRLVADAVSPSFRHVHRPSRVWLAWAFPVLNLWFPYQVVRDTRRATVGPGATSGVVRPWWVLWLAWLAADVVAFFVTGVTPEAVAWMAAGSAVLGSACGALWLRLVADITSGQRRGAAPTGPETAPERTSPTV
jgi:hypothetical protein